MYGKEGSGPQRLLLASLLAKSGLSIAPYICVAVLRHALWSSDGSSATSWVAAVNQILEFRLYTCISWRNSSVMTPRLIEFPRTKYESSSITSDRGGRSLPFASLLLINS